MPRARKLSDEIVLQNAMTVFWQRGYAGTSMRDLTQATGLSTAALYNRYADKDGLFIEVLSRYADEGLSERVNRLSSASNLAPLQAIRTFFDELVAASLADPDHKGCLLVNTLLDGAAISPEARRLVRQQFETLEGFFTTQLHRAVAEGALDRRSDVEALATGLLGSVFGLRVLGRFDPDPVRLRRFVEQALSGLFSMKDGGKQ